jgi:hypothetical protein
MKAFLWFLLLTLPALGAQIESGENIERRRTATIQAFATVIGEIPLAKRLVVLTEGQAPNFIVSIYLVPGDLNVNNIDTNQLTLLKKIGVTLDRLTTKFSTLATSKSASEKNDSSLERATMRALIWLKDGKGVPKEFLWISRKKADHFEFDILTYPLTPGSESMVVVFPDQIRCLPGL